MSPPPPVVSITGLRKRAKSRADFSLATILAPRCYPRRPDTSEDLGPAGKRCSHGYRRAKILGISEALTRFLVAQGDSEDAAGHRLESPRLPVDPIRKGGQIFSLIHLILRVAVEANFLVPNPRKYELEW